MESDKKYLIKTGDCSVIHNSLQLDNNGTVDSKYDSSSAEKKPMDERYVKRVEILRLLSLKMEQEVKYILNNIEVSKDENEHSTRYEYNENEWSKWIKDNTQSDEIKEYAVLTELSLQLHKNNFEAVVGLPYRNEGKEKYILYVSWENNRRSFISDLMNYKCEYEDMFKHYAQYMAIVCSISILFFCILIIGFWAVIIIAAVFYGHAQ